ncbi:MULTISPECIES: threonine ammonia-lyase [unclassified Nitrobacter]|uniref:threonine ammonia-lyase n=1 Tax=unclassified Nitrobacter TaxID=2620411 RepID=UPI00092809EA|nr:MULTISPECIES: threonine ammonia-lyase [unclassified Nitrobacter]MBN9146942.1 threonine ammonia-lyase [Nitrobacter sp.]OJU99658.1 MAG: threonine ammonia-lyase [Nitrobacter sp. 62-23]
MSDAEHGKSIGAADLRAAADRLAGRVIRTPLVHSRTLSDISGAEVWLKLENQQFVASFKERGAANKLLTLSPEEAKRGVIAMSAGNHAQGVAYHAHNLGIAATIVMPKSTPFVKVSRTRKLGARVRLEGEILAESAAFARQLAADENLVFVHPYNDPAVIAGQGTVAIEMLEDQPTLDCILTPVGGGGLVAGCAIAAANHASAVEVIGVEVESYAAVAQHLAGRPVSVGGATIAEGIAVRDVGALPLAILREYGIEVMTVAERLIEKAVIQMLEIEKTVTEGAGAAALAALMSNPARFVGRKVGLIISGGNIDTRTLANVLMRGLVRDGRLIDLVVEISDKPGALAELACIIAELRGNIVEVQHQRLFSALSANMTEVELVIEAQDTAHGSAIVAGLEAKGVRARRRDRLVLSRDLNE